MNFWAEISRIALLGTERTHFSEEIEAELLDLGINEDLSPAQQVLEAAAFHVQYHKISLPISQTDISIPIGHKPQVVDYISTTSITHLAHLLTKKLLPVLPEFTRNMEQLGKVFPPEYLPQLFDLSLSDSLLWNSIAAGIGERGWWLLRQHSDWQSLAQRPYSTPGASPKQVRASMEFVYKLKQSITSNPLLINATHRQQFRDAAFYADLSKYDTLISDWYLSYQSSHIWKEEAQQFLQILNFRKNMLTELER